MERLCVKCKKIPPTKGRRYCNPCYLERRKYFYLQKGGAAYKNRYGWGFCVLCTKKIKLNHKDQKYCLECYRKVSKIGNNATGNYNKLKGSSKDIHRVIAEQVLKRKLSYNEVIHHINGDIKDNSLSNMIIISRMQHGRLHFFIRDQRALIEKSIGEQDENCWKALIAQMTTTWLKTAGVKVKKLSEIG